MLSLQAALSYVSNQCDNVDGQKTLPEEACRQQGVCILLKISSFMFLDLR